MVRASIVSLLAFLLFSSPAFPSDYDEGDELRISVAKTQFKDSPSPFGAKVVSTLVKGDTVVYKDEAGAYFKVEHDGKTGFIPAKSLVEPGDFKSFSRTAEVTETDMTAATKGFSPKVEEENRKNSDLRYDLLDKAEKDTTIKDPLNGLRSFRKEGKLGEYSE